MLNDIYFKTTQNKLVTNHDIAKVATIWGDILDAYDYDAVRNYAKRCKGIVKEIKNPSIKVCLQNRDLVLAVKLYYYRHLETSLSEAKRIIDKMYEDMKSCNNDT